MKPLADRPGRQMPTMLAVARHLGLDGEAPACFRCGSVHGSTWKASGLERAHVIDRAMGGLDNPSNLRPLCRTCHSLQPPFGPGQEVEALHWFAIPQSAAVDAAIELAAGLPVGMFDPAASQLHRDVVELVADADLRSRVLSFCREAA